jgi:hypothetical protein
VGGEGGMEFGGRSEGVMFGKKGGGLCVLSFLALLIATLSLSSCTGSSVVCAECETVHE